jgi:enhancer of polycomb-like protein
MVVMREKEKKKLYDAEREVWEAKWKLFETKKRWPSLGITKDEEEIITGRMAHGTNTASSSTYGGSISMSVLNGQQALHSSHPNIPRHGKKTADREKEAEREKREKMQEVASRGGDRNGAGARWYAPEELKARMSVLRQRLDEEMAQKRERDHDWDDATDVSSTIQEMGRADR